MRRVRLLSRMLGARQTPPLTTAVLVHLPKTAGSSLRRWVLQNIRGSSFRIINPVDDFGRLAAMSLPERAALELVEGHLYYGVHEILPRPCHYFTLLRDPIERVLSYYSFIREYTDHHLYRTVLEGDLSLAQCIERGITVELDNHMTRTLSGHRFVHIPFAGVTEEMLTLARKNLSGFAAVGVTERFDESVDLLRRVFGWRGECRKRENVTVRRIRRTDVDANTLRMVRERNLLDIELYSHAVAVMDELRDRSAALPA